MISGRKECGKCHVEKDKSEFNVRKRDKDGQVISLRLECRDCENKQRRIRYVGNRGKILKRNKEYTELNKNKVYRKQTEWKEANKEYVTQKRKDRYISKGDIIKV